ncbi:MAG: glycosyltransferase, partial [Planctomycetia bacterium]
NHCSELSGLIRDYDAGWIVDPADLPAVEKVVEEVLDQPEEVRRRGANAQRLVRERLTYAVAGAPLLRFLENPTRRPRPAPAKILPMADYHAYLRVEAEYKELHKSRALQFALQLGAVRRMVLRLLGRKP